MNSTNGNSDDARVATVDIRPTLAAVADEQNPSAYFLPADHADLLVADPGRRQRVSFSVRGEMLAGDLYRPTDASPDERTPGVVLFGPISSVKEQTVPHYAERFADAGYTALTFDPRHFGESGGEPRYRYVPEAMIEDYAGAVSYLLTRDDVDPDRIAAVGVCMGGGFAVSLGARDRRVKTVVTIGGGYDIGGTFQRFLGVDGLADYLRQINDLVQRQFETGEIQYVPAIAHSLSAEVPIAAMPNEEAYSYYDRTSQADAPNWSRRMTADSLPSYLAYNAITDARLLAPTPLLVIHGTRDGQLWPEFAQQAYDAATSEKQLVWLQTHNHIEVYDQDPYVSEAARQAIRWLDRHIGAGSEAAAANGVSDGKVAA
jgi:fermentation-respiration switch protein FrsA (DUF1100 family)